MDEFSDLIPRFDLQGMDLQLDRMQAALQELEGPCRDVPAIQVAGTNGKGSIVRFIETALLRADVHCGVTTSPHLISWCERIRVSAEVIPEATLRSLLLDLQEVSRRNRLTPFELLTTTALVHFQRQCVELLVLEVGLGGRLDATTAHPHRPIIAMGQIGLDHCEHLGHSLRAIAHEKAAVISHGATVISAAQQQEAGTVLEEVCRQRQARLHWVDPLPTDWRLGPDGGVQRSNAAVALGALQALAPLGWCLAEASIRTGFSEARWAGRLQVVHWRGRALRLDGAHNPPAAKQLGAERDCWSGEGHGVIWILAIQSHKQAPEMLEHLLRAQDRAWIIPVPDHHSWTRDQLMKRQPALQRQLWEAPSVEAALHHLLTKDEWPQAMPVVAGSLYLLGDPFARNLVEAE